MRLIVNGQDTETISVTVLQLLHEMDIMPERVAVELNLKVVRRADFERQSLCEGDAVEIVYFVGGGEARAEL